MMSDLSEGQKALLLWFRFNSSLAHPISKIRLLCKNIQKQIAAEESKTYLYDYFFPLVRLGLVEFSGNGLYYLSSTLLLKKDKKLIGINLTDNQLDKVSGYIVEMIFEKSIVFFESKNAKLIKEILELKINEPNIHLALKSIPIINELKDFEKTNIYDLKGFERYDYGWKKILDKESIGCFKADSNIASIRYFRTSIDNWYKIPSRKINPDSFNWAVCYGMILNKQPLNIEYFKSEKRLEIENIHFPIILERLLWIKSIPSFEEQEWKEKKKIFRGIDYSFFKQINRIFLNKIPVNG